MHEGDQYKKSHVCAVSALFTLMKPMLSPLTVAGFRSRCVWSKLHFGFQYYVCMYVYIHVCIQ